MAFVRSYPDRPTESQKLYGSDLPPSLRWGAARRYAAAYGRDEDPHYNAQLNNAAAAFPTRDVAFLGDDEWNTYRPQHPTAPQKYRSDYKRYLNPNDYRQRIQTASTARARWAADQYLKSTSTTMSTKVKTPTFPCLRTRMRLHAIILLPFRMIAMPFTIMRFGTGTGTGTVAGPIG